MKNISFVLAGATFVVVPPVMAQSAEETAEAAADAVAEAAEATDLYVVPPPPVTVRPSEPRDRSSRPRLQNRNRGWIVQADYPISAWNADQEGSVGYDVSVDVTGKVTGCEVTESSGFAALDDAICPLVFERAEFLPALDAEGVDVAGVFEGRHRWRKKEPEAPEMRVVFQYLHDASGVTKDCELLSIEGNPPKRMLEDIEKARERGSVCPETKGRPGTPYRDENGVPVAKRVTLSLDIKVEDPE